VVFHIRARKGRKELHELTLPLDFASERLLNCRLALLHWIPRVTIGGALAKRRPSRKRKRAIAVFAIWLSSGDPPTVGSSPVRSNVSMEYTGVLGVECNIQCQYCYQNPSRGMGSVLVHLQELPYRTDTNQTERQKDDSIRTVWNHRKRSDVNLTFIYCEIFPT
jgi:sulfatase maturation enzyme AslB (radical SAM superfamily)